MSYLKDLRADPRFQLLIKEIESHRPLLPTFDPDKDNTELWKAKSGERKGFDFVMQFLKGEVNGTE